MNTLFTLSHKSRRRLVAWVVAAAFATMLMIGQPVIGQLFGIDLSKPSILIVS